MPPHCSLPWSCTGFYFCFGFLCDYVFLLLAVRNPQFNWFRNHEKPKSQFRSFKVGYISSSLRPRFFSCSSSSILHGSVQLFSRAKVGGHAYTRPLWLMLPSREEELCLPGILFIPQEVSSRFPWLTLGPQTRCFDWAITMNVLDVLTVSILNRSDMLQSGKPREKNFESATNFESITGLQDYMLGFSSWQGFVIRRLT